MLKREIALKSLKDSKDVEIYKDFTFCAQWSVRGRDRNFYWIDRHGVHVYTSAERFELLFEFHGFRLDIWSMKRWNVSIESRGWRFTERREGVFFSKRRNASGKDLCAGCGLKRSRKRSQGLQTLTYRSSFLIDDGDTSGAREVSKSWRGKWHDSARFCNGMIVCWESWQTTG